MAQDLIDNNILIGKDIGEVKQMPGHTSNSREHINWEYKMEKEAVDFALCFFSFLKYRKW